MNNNEVKRVIVVLKTHLDIGFTAMADDVMKQYCENFIPAAVELSLKVNRGEKKRFVWTVGSYLPAYYLKHADEAARERFAAAVHSGGVRWHRLPCTTHTELMDQDLFEYGLSIGEKLDEQFGIHTIAAKMTDVPGHTAAMVPILYDHGIEYLHIGVNASSRVPNVPRLFLWRFGEKEIIVQYAADYGEAAVLKDGTALEFFHAHDNQGPPSEKDLEAEWKRLSDKYPNARIEAGTLDDFALVLRKFKDELPVLDQEIGDTWIHGAGTDPLKVSHLKRLLLLKDKWLEEGRLTRQQPEYQEFMEQLLMVTEHTWGMDAKKYLLDFTHWSKADFTKAREMDVTDYSMMAAGEAQEAIAAAMRPEQDTYRGAGNDKSSYRLFEQSHLEQRQYVEKAILALPADLAEQARQALEWQRPAREAFEGQCPAGEDGMVGAAAGAEDVVLSASAQRVSAQKAWYEVGGWEVQIGDQGQIVHLINRARHFDRQVSLGLFCYETFGPETVEKCFHEYGRDLDVNLHWAAYDFSKPGMENAADAKDAVFQGKPGKICVNEDRLNIELVMEEEACERYGCPRCVEISHQFLPDRIKTEIFWEKKDALRTPEALWLQMNPFGQEGTPASDGDSAVPKACWKIRKLGSWIDPKKVVSGGARKLHACEAVGDSETAVTPLDSPLLSVGKRNLYNVEDKVEDLQGGVWFNLFNNRWGTNFKQWFDEDMRFEFVTEFFRG